jgi:hypothetical protein
MIRLDLSSAELPATAFSLFRAAEFSIALILSLLDDLFRFYCSFSSEETPLGYIP